jgi:hypothetical protein
MVTIPIPHSGESARGQASLPAPVSEAKSPDWIHWMAAGAVVAGGVLIVTGNRRAGLAIAAAGTTLALIEEKNAVAGFWRSLPGYLVQAHDVLDQIEHYMGKATIQGQRIQRIMRR